MLRNTGSHAAQALAEYEAFDDDARQIAIAWTQLTEPHKVAIRDMIFTLATAHRHMPWLIRGRPKSESYDDYEQRVEQNFQAMINLAAHRKA